MTQQILVFLAIFASDVAWVLCVRNVQNNDAALAGIWAVGIFLPTAFATVSYVQDHILLVPAAAGHFLGTYCTVWYQNLKSRHE